MSGDAATEDICVCVCVWASCAAVDGEVRVNGVAALADEPVLAAAWLLGWTVDLPIHGL